MRLPIAAIAALVLAATPVAGQDLLQSFERFVENTLPQRTPPPRQASPAPVEAAQPTPAEERPTGADLVETADPNTPPLPRPRPDAPDAPQASDTATSPRPGAGDAAAAPPEPERPAQSRVYQTACPALLGGIVVGKMLDPITDGICGERSPLEVTAVRVNGREIGFSSPVTTNCQMAGALADWLGEVAAYAKAALDSPVATLNTGTSMMCRNRYGAADGFVSEHGFANAIDVTGFTLEDGRTIAVEVDWMPAGAVPGRLLRQAHGAACGRFTTVLGPEANAEHEDHFHLDLGCHGQTCTAQICE